MEKNVDNNKGEKRFAKNAGQKNGMWKKTHSQ